jgi:hypothetical protein
MTNIPPKPILTRTIRELVPVVFSIGEGVIFDKTCERFTFDEDGIITIIPPKPILTRTIRELVPVVFSIGEEVIFDKTCERFTFNEDGIITIIVN